MPNLATIAVKFLGNKTVTFSNTTLKEAVKVCAQYPFANYHPLLITLSTGVKLYFHTELLLNWLQGNVIYEDLFLTLKTDGLFRNSEYIYEAKGEVEIDPGSLWSKKGNKCYLVDDDQTVIATFDPIVFKEIE